MELSTVSTYHEQRERFRLYEPDAAAYARYRREVEAYELAFTPAPLWARLGAVSSTSLMLVGAAGPWLRVELSARQSASVGGLRTDGLFVALFGIVALVLLIIALVQPDTEVPAAFALGAIGFSTFIAFMSVFFLKSYRPGVIGVATSSIMLGWGVYLTAAASLLATAFTVLVVRRSTSFY